MKRLLFVGLVVAAAIWALPPTEAAPGGCTINPILLPMNHETLTVSTSSIGFTATKYAPSGQTPADLAVVDVETAAIRYWADGVAPTSTVGHPVAAATSFTVCGFPSISNIHVIRSGGSDATLSISYYRAAQ